MSSPTPRFGIAINRGVDHVEVTFTPQRGAPSGVVWYVATLVDGIAMSGDGFDYGDVTEAITTVFYDSDRVDASSITTPNPLGVVRGTTVAVFLTWNAEGGEMLAVGAEGPLGEAGFELREVTDTAEALAFLAASGDDATTAFFTELGIAGFRGFAEMRTLRLARPNGEEGSGLTFLVGANNSGESTFIEHA